MLLEPRRALAQQKHNREHGGTFNSEIPEIPPIKKHADVFFQITHSLLSKPLLWNDHDPCKGGLWEIKSLKTILKSEGFTCDHATLWGKSHLIVWLEFNRFSIFQQSSRCGGVPMFSWLCFFFLPKTWYYRELAGNNSGMDEGEFSLAHWKL